MGKKQKTMNGFTIVELLTVIAIIAILIGVLIPSMNLVRNTARETKQKSQFATIDQALLAFRSDYGDYPPSDNDDGDYCGAQKLAEALLGWDLLGFQPSSQANGWRPNFIAAGHINHGGVYDPDYLDERKGPYLELATANAFKLIDLFNPSTPLAPDTFVLCDSFGVKQVSIGGKAVKAGTPILYYKANTASKTIKIGDTKNRIYDYYDNADIIYLNDMAVKLDEDFFYSDGFIIDPRVTARPWPYRADSYILISAGIDGLYGTSDDICNF
ncbi:MAG: hypothetical protein DRP62_03005 [Planctomycetota bacterium]|nr:MAG: hypothetical protein DRP62_03005 [Planctomycetota bacterium]